MNLSKKNKSVIAIATLGLCLVIAIAQTWVQTRPNAVEKEARLYEKATSLKYPYGTFRNEEFQKDKDGRILGINFLDVLENGCSSVDASISMYVLNLEGRMGVVAMKLVIEDGERAHAINHVSSERMSELVASTLVMTGSIRERLAVTCKTSKRKLASAMEKLEIAGYDNLVALADKGRGAYAEAYWLQSGRLKILTFVDGGYVLHRGQKVPGGEMYTFKTGDEAALLKQLNKMS